jgi:hypothetical protein
MSILSDTENNSKIHYALHPSRQGSEEKYKNLLNPNLYGNTRKPFESFDIEVNEMESLHQFLTGECFEVESPPDEEFGCEIYDKKCFLQPFFISNMKEDQSPDSDMTHFTFHSKSELEPKNHVVPAFRTNNNSKKDDFLGNSPTNHYDRCVRDRRFKNKSDSIRKTSFYSRIDKTLIPTRKERIEFHTTTRISNLNKYWGKKSKLVPTTFTVSFLSETRRQMEYKDYSMKEILLEEQERYGRGILDDTGREESSSHHSKRSIAILEDF